MYKESNVYFINVDLWFYEFIKRFSRTLVHGTWFSYYHKTLLTLFSNGFNQWELKQFFFISYD